MQTSLIVENKRLARAQPRPRLTNAVLFLVDLACLAVSLLVGAVAAHYLASPGTIGILTGYLPMVVVVPLVFALLNHYPAAGMSPVDEMRGQVLSVTGLFTLQAAFMLAAHGPRLDLFAVTALTWVTAVVSVTSSRVLTRYLLAHKPWWGVPVMILGAGRTAELVIERLRQNPALNLKVIQVLDDDPRKLGNTVAGVPVVATLGEAAGFKQALEVDYVIVAMPGLDPVSLSNLVQSLGRTFTDVVVIPNTFTMASVGVGTRDSGGVIGLHVRGHLSLPSNLVAKRIIDLCLLVPLGLVAAPVIALSALAVMLLSPGNPFYTQVREGRNGRPIRILKLRTMHPNADTLLEEHLATDPAAKSEWQTHFKLQRDPRIIPIVGGLLRRLSFDELPQVFNIARGDMSFVGPRPFPYYHLDQFDPAFRDLRCSVAPGLTGYWQVTSRSTADLLTQVELDSYYIRNWSLWVDFYILVRTPWAVLFGSGAY